MPKYEVSAPAVPGIPLSVISTHETLAEARKAARRFSADRRDLKNHDVRIDRLDGRLVEYAGPCR